MNSDNSSKGANAHIKEYLNDYCNLSNPQFAVLLKGPWGSGKTWLIKKFMKDFGRNNFLYISLYGMQTLEEVDHEFFRQLHPVFGSDEAKFFAKSILQIIMRTKSDFKIKDIPGFLKNAHDKTLIFDDLERCHIEIDHVLGYINGFVEHQFAKVIVVANEEGLFSVHENQTHKNSYKLIKEKTIGQVLEIDFHLQEIIESLIEDLCDNEDLCNNHVIKNQEIEVFVKSHIQTIESIYKCKEDEKHEEYKNIRTLRKIILDLDRIWTLLPANVIQSEEAIRELFELLIIFSIESSQGNIDFTEFHDVRTQYQKFYMQKHSSSDSHKPETKIHKLIKKYNSLRQILSRGHNLFPIDRWWVEFLDRGILNKKLLEQSIQYSPYFRDKNTKSWLKLYQYDTLTDEKFIEALEDVENKFLEKEFDDPSIVTHAFGILLELSDIGLSKKSFSILESAMKSYVQRWREVGIFLEFVKTVLKHDQNLELLGLEVRGQNHNSFKVLLEYMVEYHRHDQQIALQHEANHLLEVMKDSPYEFKVMINTFVDENNNYHPAKYQSIAILHLIKVSDFVEAFLSLEPMQQNLIVYTIVNRHELDRRVQVLTGEYQWISSVIESLKVEAANRKKIPLLSGFILENQIYKFESEISGFIDVNSRDSNQNSEPDL